MLDMIAYTGGIIAALVAVPIAAYGLFILSEITH